MEFEDVSEKVEWEARRVAAAFGAEQIVQRGKTLSTVSSTFQGRQLGGFLIIWKVSHALAHWRHILVNADGQKPCWIRRDSEMTASNTVQCTVHPKQPFNDSMERGLYCLGFEDENVLAKLNHPLTAHEKLELRLSIPREFWPKKW